MSHVILRTDIEFKPFLRQRIHRDSSKDHTRTFPEISQYFQ